MSVVSRGVVFVGCVLAVAASSAAITSGEVYRSMVRAEGGMETALDFKRGYVLGKAPVFAAVEGTEFVADNGAETKCVNGITWRVPLRQTTALPFTVAAESLFERGTAGSAETQYSLYLDVRYVDGSSLYGQTHCFIPRTGLGWQKGVVSVLPDKPVASVSCYLLFRFRDGRARFRAPVVRAFSNPDLAVFDAQPVQVVNAVAEEAFLLHDAANPADGWEAVSDGSVAKGVKVAVKREKRGGAVFFDTCLESQGDDDRAMTFACSVPLPAGELVWLDDPRTEMVMGSGQYRNAVRIGCGEGSLTTWPFGAVRAGGRVFALGFDPSAPAIFRVAGSGRLRRLYITFDVGFAKEKRDARFRFVLFESSAKDGFRGALAEYARLYPESFRVRIRKHGIWMAFAPISKVEGFEDFGFGIKEGDQEPAWDDAHGILTTHYTEPTSWWMTIRATNEVSFADARALAEAETLKEKRRHPYARAWKVSTYLDEAGTITGKVCDRPWCKGAVWNMNPLPGIAGGEYSVKLSEADFAKRYKGTFPSGVDGEYIDSAECHLPPRADFNRAHFAASKTPLCWSTGSHRPCVSTALAIYEYVRGAAERVHALGRIMQANGAPYTWPWLIPFVDYGGQETKWIERGEGAWKPMSDRALLYRMAMSYGKPYCFLMNVKFENLTDEMLEKYFHRCLAYGLMSSFFSPNASGGHFFTRPELYNKCRPLFRKYGSLQRRISEAGWRPINTLVAAESGGAFVEQFGDRYVTVFNSGTKPVRVTLRRLSGAGPADELVMGSKWAFEGGTHTVEIPPETCRLLLF